MRLYPLPLAGADRGALRLAILCLIGVAVLVLGAFAFTEIVPARAHNSVRAPSAPTMTPFMVLPTVPQASDVLPAAPTRDEPDIATHGG